MSQVLLGFGRVAVGPWEPSEQWTQSRGCSRSCLWEERQEVVSPPGGDREQVHRAVFSFRVRSTEDQLCRQRLPEAHRQSRLQTQGFPGSQDLGRSSCCIVEEGELSCSWDGGGDRGQGVGAPAVT